MVDLSFAEKRALERFLISDNGPGYVLDFSDRSFQEFIGDATGLDITQDKYKEAGTSKANRLKTLYRIETDYTIGKLLAALYEYKIAIYRDQKKPIEQNEFSEIYKISQRLLTGGAVVENIDAIQASNDDKDFNQLAKLIRESIEKNEPEAALDRLHTFMIKFLKELCNSYKVDVLKDDTVNALYGKYFKAVKDKGYIESEMTKTILQFSFQVIEAFNDIRNNKSFAHDNPVLNYDESVLIFSNVTSTIKFIQKLELKHQNLVVENAKPEWTQDF